MNSRNFSLSVSLSPSLSLSLPPPISYPFQESARRSPPSQVLPLGHTKTYQMRV